MRSMTVGTGLLLRRISLLLLCLFCIFCAFHLVNYLFHLTSSKSISTKNASGQGDGPDNYFKIPTMDGLKRAFSKAYERVTSSSPKAQFGRGKHDDTLLNKRPLQAKEFNESHYNHNALENGSAIDLKTNPSSSISYKDEYESIKLTNIQDSKAKPYKNIFNLKNAKTDSTSIPPGLFDISVPFSWTMETIKIEFEKWISLHQNAATNLNTKANIVSNGNVADGSVNGSKVQPDPPSMDDYLWNNFHIRSIPYTPSIEPGLRWEMSVKRHVALFYGQYLILGGKERRRFEIPTCSSIGISISSKNSIDASTSHSLNSSNLHSNASKVGADVDNRNNNLSINLFGEYRSKSLNRLAGSQGNLGMIYIPYFNPASPGDASVAGVKSSRGTDTTKGLHEGPSRLKGTFNSPFQLDQDGRVELIVKHFDSEAKSSESLSNSSSTLKKEKGKMKGKVEPPSASDESTSEREEQRRHSSLKIFEKELYALSILQNPSIIQPVCYDRGGPDTASAQPLLVFPRMTGGDLVPISTDHPFNLVKDKEIEPFQSQISKVQSAGAEGKDADKYKRKFQDKKSDGMPLQSKGLQTLSKIPLNPEASFLSIFFRQLAEALFDVHSAGLVHLDVKPENLVVAGPDRLFAHLSLDSKRFQNNISHPLGKCDNNSSYRLVLLDFGLSMTLKDIHDIEDECVKVGTDVTMAPEQFMCNAPTERGTDWWAFGAALWRTRVFWEPSIGSEERERLLSMTDPQWGHPSFTPLPSFFSPTLSDLLLNHLLLPKPEQRDHSLNQSTFKKLLAHPFFNMH